MAKFLNTRKAVSEIEDLIRNAGEKLILVSPYLKLSKDFKELLTYRNSKDKITTIVFGKQELNPDEMKFLQGLRFVILNYNEDLHAKCYLNDSKMIITSLNLYQFSMANNKEMGVLIDKNDSNDSELYAEALDEVDFIIKNSQRFEVGTSKPVIAKPERIEKSNIKKNSGYCIRTGVEITFNIERPLSGKAFESWSKYGDEEYPEKYCHFSGEPSNGDTCFMRPILKKNWNKAKDLLN
jgi:phosphatidylserine/phosphatidylglycerophosphate/cardiolipin synthase-like enzyme